MKTLAALFSIALSACCAPAYAQQAASTSEALSSSGIYMEGSNISANAPSMPAPGIHHTAPCIIGRSSGVSVAGFGVSGGGGSIDENCNTREEVVFLSRLLEQPPGPARTAGIYHACANDESLRRTLVAMGACVMR